MLNLPALKKRGFLCQPQRFSPASAREGGELLSVRLRTFRPTRSGSGDAEASGLRQGLFHVALAVVTVLRQFGMIGRNFGQGAASFCNYASQMGYKQPWGTKSDTATVLFLPAFEGGFLDLHVICLHAPGH